MITTRAGTLTFKVKMAGLSRYYRSRTPYKSHNAKHTWFVLVFDVIMQWVYSINLFQNIKFHIHMNYDTVKHIINITNYKQIEYGHLL